MKAIYRSTAIRICLTLVVEMNSDDIVWRLAQLASLPYQERYVINGSPSEYVLDSELLENVDGLKFYFRRPENQGALVGDQADAVDKVISYIEAHSDEALSGDSREARSLLIRESEVWTTLRRLAAHALSQFGLAVDELSIEDIDRLSGS